MLQKLRKNNTMTHEKRQEKLDNYLLYIPKKKHREWELKEDKVLLVFHHDRWIERLMRWLVKKPYVSDITLDDVGSKVWLAIDDTRTVFEIAQKLLEEYGPSFDPDYKRVTLFLNYLNKKGWISFARGPQVYSPH